MEHTIKALLALLLLVGCSNLLQSASLNRGSATVAVQSHVTQPIWHVQAAAKTLTDVDHYTYKLYTHPGHVLKATNTSTSGNTVFTSVPDGTYRLSAEAFSSADDSVSITQGGPQASSNQVTVAASGSGPFVTYSDGGIALTVALNLLGETGETIDNEVTLTGVALTPDHITYKLYTDPDDVLKATYTSANLTTAFTAVPNGSYRMTAEAFGSTDDSTSITQGGAQTSNVVTVDSLGTPSVSSDFAVSLTLAIPIPGALDSLNGAPASAYSTRLLRGTYFGKALRVRRSSDDSEADIGFDATGNLNQAALLSHVGAGDGFVSRWYDQIGSNTVTQTTAAAQPKIVSSGTVITGNSRPVVRFNGSNVLSTASFAGFANKSGVTIFSAMRPQAGNGSYARIFYYGATADQTRISHALGGPTVGSTSGILMNVSNGFNSAGYTDLIYTVNVSALNASVFDGAQTGNANRLKYYLNGTAKTVQFLAPTIPATTSAATKGASLGGEWDSVSGRYIGDIFEVIVYPVALANTDRQAIETDIRTYFSL